MIDFGSAICILVYGWVDVSWLFYKKKQQQIVNSDNSAYISIHPLCA